MCALLRRNVLGRKIIGLGLHVDPLLWPVLKNNPNPEQELAKLKQSLENRTITSVGRHGKYFWLRLTGVGDDGVLLMHFGMTGMVKLRNVESHMIFMENGGDKKVLQTITETDSHGKVKRENQEAVVARGTGTTSKFFKRTVVKEEAVESVDEADLDTEAELLWPPRFSKFEMELEKDGHTLEFAFVDPRRLGRIRYLSGPEVATDEGLLQVAPLQKLGPDYSKRESGGSKDNFVFGDPDPHHHGRPRLLLEAFNKLVLSKKKPIKALLLEQEYFAGVGNWVSDEIVYQARIHPGEVISSKIAPGEEVHEAVKRLYDAVKYVCEKSVEVEGDAKQFPDDWLMLHRWGKGRKGKAKTKLGHTVEFETIGGRTSCFVPELQRALKRAKLEDTLATPKAEKAPNSKAAGATPKGRAVKEEVKTGEKAGKVNTENEGVGGVASPRRSKRIKRS